MGANYKFRGGDTSRYAFDNTTGNNAVAGAGLPTGAFGGIEPLGRFRAGPIGTAFGQDDLYLRLNYKF